MAAAVAAPVAVVGLLVGWLWLQAAPRVVIERTANGFVYAEPAPEQAVAGDGWFALLATGTGAALAVAAWMLLRRHRGIAVLVGLAVGSLAAAALAGWLGHEISAAQFDLLRDTVAVGTRVDAPLRLRITDLGAPGWLRWSERFSGVAAVQALSAVFVYTFLAGFSATPDLRAPGTGVAAASRGERL